MTLATVAFTYWILVQIGSSVSVTSGTVEADTMTACNRLRNALFDTQGVVVEDDPITIHATPCLSR